MRAIVWKYYLKSFPALKQSLEQFRVEGRGSFSRPSIKNLRFIDIYDMSDLDQNTRLSNIFFKLDSSTSIGKMEAWIVTREKTMQLGIKKDCAGEIFSEGEPIGEALLRLKSSVDYLVILNYYYSDNIRQVFSIDGCPGDMESSEDFWIKIYTSAQYPHSYLKSILFWFLQKL